MVPFESIDKQQTDMESAHESLVSEFKAIRWAILCSKGMLSHAALALSRMTVLAVYRSKLSNYSARP